MSNQIQEQESQPKTYPATRVCSYCGKFLGMKEGFPKPNLVTHGICEDCHKREMDKLLEEMKR